MVIINNTNINNPFVKYVNSRYRKTKVVTKKEQKSKTISKLVCKYNVLP
jgi:hypothetical protein